LKGVFNNEHDDALKGRANTALHKIYSQVLSTEDVDAMISELPGALDRATIVAKLNREKKNEEARLKRAAERLKKEAEKKVTLPKPDLTKSINNNKIQARGAKVTATGTFIPKVTRPRTKKGGNRLKTRRTRKTRRRRTRRTRKIRRTRSQRHKSKKR
jgi:hypothetical protein